MASNFDSSFDKIEKIIPFPKINQNIGDLFSEEEKENKSNIDLNNNNLDIFEYISQIDEEEEENSINLRNNNKNPNLLATYENTENSKKQNVFNYLVKNSNKFDFLNIKSNRINNNKEKKYKILFDKIKDFNLNSLREEYIIKQKVISKIII